VGGVERLRRHHGGLNKAYRVTEVRPFWYRRMLAAVLVIAVGFGLITAFEILLVGSSLVTNSLKTIPGAPTLPALVGWARWPSYFLVAFFVALALYSIAPALPRVSWRWTAPGRGAVRHAVDADRLRLRPLPLPLRPHGQALRDPRARSSSS
jgi:uncharacterized BrkB/YihY/UPF0761 family membrane protein